MPVKYGLEVTIVVSEILEFCSFICSSRGIYGRLILI